MTSRAEVLESAIQSPGVARRKRSSIPPARDWDRLVGRGYLASSAAAAQFDSVDAVRRAYISESLQSFLDISYGGCRGLLSAPYLARVAAERVCDAEIFFDLQTHTLRGVEFASVIGGIYRTLEDGRQRWGISSN
jgi:adenosine deaminase